MDKLHEELATETGVSAEHVKKVLDKLGLPAVEREASACMGREKVASIKLGQLKLAVRIGNSCIAV